MKNIYSYFICIFLWIIGIISSPVNAQVTRFGNAGLFTDYVGWNAAQAFPLQIRHNGNQPISLFTNNAERMRIFHTNLQGREVTRVSIHRDGTAPITNPVALFNLGSNPQNNPQGGHRLWMDVGTFTCAGTDNMYVGLKDENNPANMDGDRKDAVINWGDNQGAGNAGPDYMRFIFTGPPSLGGIAGQENGLEVARLAPTGNYGIGNFYNSPFHTATRNPARRLEILSDKAGPAANGNAQLRLTHTQQNPSGPNSTGKFAELHNVNSGNLGIMARDNTQVNTSTRILKERFVGINTINAGNTLEINSQFTNSTVANGQPQAIGFGPATGWSGLRFSDLKSSSIPQANPGSGVLSLDANGDVIYVPASTNPFGSCPAPSLLNQTSAIGLNGFNFIYSGEGRVGIGTDCAPAKKLEVVDDGMNLLSYEGRAQLRLTQNNNRFFPGGLKYTDLQTHLDGHFLINARGEFRGRLSSKNVGINLTGKNASGAYDVAELPTQMLDVNGNGRFRALTIGTNTGIVTHEANGTLHTLAFNNDPTTVLLGNGTWGTTTGGGLNCWDLNGNGIKDPNEDINRDGLWDTEDCRGVSANDKFVNAITVNNPTGSPKNITLGFSDGTSITSNEFGDNSGNASVTATNGTWVNAAGQVELGTNPLNHNTEVPLNNFNLTFTDPVTPVSGSNKIGIGTNYPNGKIDVFSSQETHAGKFTSNSAGAWAVLDATYNGTAQYISALTATNLVSTGTGGSFYGGEKGIVAFATQPSSSTNTGVKALATDGVNNQGIHTQASSNLSNALNWGTTSIASGSSSMNWGVIGSANGALNKNVGVSGDGAGGAQNYGGIFRAWGPASNENAGFVASAEGGTINIGIRASGDTYAGYFIGNVIRTGSDNFSSDEKLKENIISINNASVVLNQLKPKSYNFKTNEYSFMNLAEGLQHGLIAQDVEPILPELVKNNILPAQFDSLGNEKHPAVEYKTLNYSEFIPFLIKGFQEQQTQIDSLNTINDTYLAQLNNQKVLIDSLFAMFNKLPKGLGGGGARTSDNSNSNDSFGPATTIKNIELSNKNNIVLNQNSPNPFKEQTTIAYFIPENVNYAQIVFTDGIGRIIKTVDINEQGPGQLNVYANDLTSGIYHYSLIIDGKTVDTKKMVRTK